MPELPEVETTLLGIQPHLQGQTIAAITVRQSKLRWPVPHDIDARFKDSRIEKISRRGKYLLLQTATGTLLIHLGMSGRLSLVSTTMPPLKHDHIDVLFQNQCVLRYTDPRRFGAFLWIENEKVAENPLLNRLGVEPLEDVFSGEYLWKQAKNRNKPIKTFIMDHHIVVGIGNIYATEALFLTGIHPATPSKNIQREQIDLLVIALKKILQEAIAIGGTTLKDFLGSDGQRGYFSLKLQVYGRAGLPCPRCRTLLGKCMLGQRTSTYCPKCQIF